MDVAKLLGVRSIYGITPDMEIVKDYKGIKTHHHGDVELFFRETRYAKYNVLSTAKTCLDKLGIEYNPSDSFCGGEGQIFIKPVDYAMLENIALSASQSNV
tara:strand:+ start:1253 stop:1555 length:303 start_codon:yes stop_codon:yes gene_type:complete